MSGPQAHHPSVRRRRNRKETAADLASPPEPRGPELPKEYVLLATGQGVLTREYSETTRRWWQTIRTAPQASAYTAAHWEWLVVLAPLFDRWVAMGDMDALKELRLQAPPFGLRPADANKLDWTIDTSVVGPAGRQAEEDDGDLDEEPPRAGKGSGTKAWRTYAVQVLGLDVEPGATRGEIIAAVDAHKNGRPARRDPRLTVYDGAAAGA